MTTLTHPAATQIFRLSSSVNLVAIDRARAGSAIVEGVRCCPAVARGADEKTLARHLTAYCHNNPRADIYIVHRSQCEAQG